MRGRHSFGHGFDLQETRITGWNLPGIKYQTSQSWFWWIKGNQRFNSAMIMPQGYAKWVINISLKNYFHWSCDHGIFCQVCESARINFESYRRAVKAACQCPPWACWCYDVDLLDPPFINRKCSPINHPRIMSDHSYDILPKRGPCLLSYKYNNDKDTSSKKNDSS